MKCPVCNNKTIELFTSRVCDYCDEQKALRQSGHEWGMEPYTTKDSGPAKEVADSWMAKRFGAKNIIGPAVESTKKVWCLKGCYVKGNPSPGPEIKWFRDLDDGTVDYYVNGVKQSDGPPAKCLDDDKVSESVDLLDY